MSEDEILAWIERFHRGAADVGARLGIGDDAAVLAAPEEGCELLLTTDQIIENKHFVRSTHPADKLGGKTLARGLSDIAAMGGRPRWFLLSLALPTWVKEPWIKQYLSGMFHKAELLGVANLPLVGGDLAASDAFSACVTVGGTAPAGRALLRSGAGVGDRVWISGALGGSALGLERLTAGTAGPGDPAVDRHLDPTPRLALGPALLEAGATAAMDLSDGLSSDLERLAGASGVGVELDAAAIPRFPGADLGQALHGGEEYELLFTARPDFLPPAETGGVALTPIGRVTAEPGLRLREGDRVTRLDVRGFDHFR